MAWPKHKNPKTTDRTAHAPYNFVPLPDKEVLTKRDELPYHDCYFNNCHTGYLDCTLLTETPLYIRCPFTMNEFKKLVDQERQKREENKKIPIKEKVANKPDFYYTNEEDKEKQPVIPGSSLRGMLRTLVEIVSFSKITAVSEQKLFYRAVADPTLGREYRQMMSRVKAGYVIEHEKKFWIIPAQIINGHTFFKIKETILLKLNFPGFKPMYDYENVKLKPDPNYKPQYLYPIWFQPPHGRDNRGRPIDTVWEVSDKQLPHFYPGVVVCSGFIENKKKHTIVTAKNNVPLLEIPDSVICDYQESLTEFQQNEPFSKHYGCLKDSQERSVEQRPIFYLEQSGKVEWIGHTPNFRVPYRQNSNIATPLNFVPKALRNTDSLDLAEAIFGFIKKMPNNKTDAYASRVFFTDARMLPLGQTDPYLSRKPIRPRILAGPKPTTFQHYLVQTNPQNKSELKHYGSIPGKETVIRGHKLYWHQGKIFLDEIEEIEPVSPIETEAPNKEDKPDTQHTFFKPLRPGLRFQFRIYFENLSEVELGALLWVLRLPVGNPDNYRHKLGMGKPFGMGSIKLESRLYLTDRQPRSDRSARYDRLFEKDGSWATGRTSVPEEIAVASQSLKVFEQKVVGQVAKDDQQNGQLADLDRIRALLRLLEWPGLEDRELSGYMSIEEREYRNRPVLPTPVPLIHKRGITRVRIRNYKSLADIDVRMEKQTILVGTNGSGKSNFMDALRFVAEAVDDLNEAINQRGGIAVLRRWSAPNKPPCTISISLNFEDELLSGEYYFEIVSKGERYQVAREHCFIWVENEFHVYQINQGDIQSPPSSSDEKVLPSPALSRSYFPQDRLALKVAAQLFPFKEVYSLLSEMHLYAIDPEALRQHQKSDDVPKAMYKTGDNLAAIWQTMEKNKSELLDEIQRIMQMAIPSLAKVQVNAEGKELIIKFQHDWEEDNTPLFEAKQESDGTLRLLGLLTALFQEPEPAVLAIEEPENTIHPGLLQALYRVLSETSQERSQIIISTHSPDLLMQARVGDLRAVEIENGITKIGEIEETQREAIREQLVSVGEIMRMEGIRHEP